MVPSTRQCCGVSAVAATTRADIETMPSALNEERLSQAFDGAESAVEYRASELLALAKGCAAAGKAVTQTAPTIIRTRIRDSLAGGRPNRAYFDTGRPQKIFRA